MQYILFSLIFMQSFLDEFFRFNSMFCNVSLPVDVILFHKLHNDHAGG